MNALDRVHKTIDHEEPDRIPSFEASIDNIKICQYYGENYDMESTASMQKLLYNLCFGNARLMNRIIKRMEKSKYFTNMMVRGASKLYRKIGLDICATPLALFPTTYTREGIVDEYGRRMDYKLNPSDGMTMLYYMGGAFDTFEEYQEYPSLDPDLELRERLFRAGKQLEKEYDYEIFMIPAIMGMMEATWEGFGLQNFSKLLAHPSQAKRVFDDRGKFAVEMVKRILEWGEETALLIYDDYGYKKGLFMRPRNYREYVIPWLKRICDTAHKGGVKVLLHSCGDNYKLLDDIINAGVDALHPIEPTTANPEYDIFKLNEKYGERLCFVGNVSPQDLSDKEPDYIRAYTKKLIKKVAPGGGFILSSGHSINPAVKLENFLAMRETLAKYGNYPITME
ncbi:MAG: hypothetical protein JW776_04755 [Candidatus Lokiarchaeota archaeon]|nr:hypothetical protein [Candidatus Lokiarchaeota archaeon]